MLNLTFMEATAGPAVAPSVVPSSVVPSSVVPSSVVPCSVAVPAQAAARIWRDAQVVAGATGTDVAGYASLFAVGSDVPAHTIAAHTVATDMVTKRSRLGSPPRKPPV